MNSANFQKVNLKINYLVNLLDGGFFGFALGFASFNTILPLFISTFTNSAILIGLIPAIQNVGWQLPQLFVARAVSRQTHYKPMTMFYTIHERLPFLGLALVAWFSPAMGKEITLVLIYLCLIWQGLGGGFTANAWQNLIVRVFPLGSRATFFGAQFASFNLLASLGALIAGFILARLVFPTNYALCFLIASVLMLISYAFLGYTREPDRPEEPVEVVNHPFWKSVRLILAEDVSFRWFLVAKLFSQFGLMATAFYTIYAVRHHGMDVATAGIMTSVVFITQVVANPLAGWLSDHWQRKSVLEIGALGLAISPVLAWFAPNLGWFFGAMVISGFSTAVFFTLGMAFTLEYGDESRRPTYIGLANTLIAPATILAPFIGGGLADSFGFESTFLAAAFAGLLTLVVMHFMVSDPRNATHLA